MANIPTHVIFRGRKTRVLGWHAPSKMWILDNPGYESAPHFVPNERVTHIKDNFKIKKRDSRYAHRKHLAAGLAYTGAGIGITALGTRGGASAVRHLKPLGKWKKHANHLEGASTTLTTVGAGTGAVGGINFARIQNEEAKQKIAKMEGANMSLRKLDAATLRSMIQKDDYNARLGRIKRQAAMSDESVAHPQKSTKSKPNTYSVTPKKMFDSERSRKRRSYVYEGGAIGGSAGAAFGAARPAPPDIKAGRAKLKENISGFHANMAESERLFNEQQSAAGKAKGGYGAHIHAKLRRAQFHMGEAGKGSKELSPKIKALRASRTKWGAASVGLAAGAAAIHHNRNNQGRSYSSWHDGSAGPKKIKLTAKSSS